MKGSYQTRRSFLQANAADTSHFVTYDRAPAPSFQPRAHTAASLAEHWGTSDTFVYDLIKAGKLRAFRLGGKLIRIPIDAVEEYERAQMIEVAPVAPVEISPDELRRRELANGRLIRAQARR